MLGASAYPIGAIPTPAPRPTIRRSLRTPDGQSPRTGTGRAAPRTGSARCGVPRRSPVTGCVRRIPHTGPPGVPNRSLMSVCLRRIGERPHHRPATAAERTATTTKRTQGLAGTRLIASVVRPHAPIARREQSASAAGIGSGDGMPRAGPAAEPVGGSAAVAPKRWPRPCRAAGPAGIGTAPDGLRTGTGQALRDAAYRDGHR